MEETIHGTTMPVLELSLQPGEAVVSEAGQFSWMSDAMQMDTNTGGGMGGKGLMGAVKRAVSGASIMMTTYTATGGAGSIAFAAKVPGHILPIDVAPGNEFMMHRHGFLCATSGIELSVGFQQSFRGGIFGGEGFILQKIAGEGRAFIELQGEVIVYDLQPGQSMRVHPGHAGLFQGSVTFSVATFATAPRGMTFTEQGVVDMDGGLTPTNTWSYTVTNLVVPVKWLHVTTSPTTKGRATVIWRPTPTKLVTAPTTSYTVSAQRYDPRTHLLLGAPIATTVGGAQLQTVFTGLVAGRYLFTVTANSDAGPALPSKAKKRAVY